MMNFVGASLKSAKNGTFLLLFIKRVNHIILPASHGLLKNPDGYVIIMLMSIF